MSRTPGIVSLWAQTFREGDGSDLDRRMRDSALHRPLESADEMAQIAGRTLRELVRRPREWIPAAIEEASVGLRRCSVPVAISALVYVIGFASVIFGAITYSIGAADREPPGVYTGLLRELATWITMMIIAGVAGSALAADIASRKIRDELDALDVLGVNRFRLLVVPRVAGMTLVAVVLPLLIHIVTTAGNMLAVSMTLHLSLATQVESIELAMNPHDLYAACIKHLIIGFFLAVVACQKGLAARGGAEGVGRAVNETVIVSFVGIWLINALFNTGYLTVVPDALELRG